MAGISPMFQQQLRSPGKFASANRLPRKTTWQMVVLLSLICSFAVAQDVQFARQRGPYYVGEVVLVQIVASGFKGSDEVDCKLAGDLPDGLTVSGPQLGRSSRSFMRVINGKVTRSESVDYRFSFSVTADRAGRFDIGPFEFTANGKLSTVDGASFNFGKLKADPNMEIGFSITNNTVYVGQKVPVAIRWAYAGEAENIQYAYQNLQIRSPLFDQFSFSDEPRRTRRRTTLTLATTKGGVEIEGEVSQETKDGKDVIVVTGQRTLVADSTGEFASIPISCRTKKVTRWGRDLFGERVAAKSTPSLATGEPLSITVKPIPSEGRPTEYAGAIGTGFSINVAANRSVVRVGDPISLSITIQGDGNLEAVSLPNLATQMGLGEQNFQIPTEKPAGTIDGSSKQFSVSVRVKNQNVDQVPALSFSWFDPEREEFLSTTSKPVALQVMETKIVSSADVFSNSGANSNQNSAGTTSEQQSGRLDLIAGANLAIETDANRLLKTGARRGFWKYLPAVIYGATLLFGVAVLLRSRRTDDSIEANRKKTRLNEVKKNIRRAGQQNGTQAFNEIAESLRAYVREYEPGKRTQIERLIAQCDNATYAPTDSMDEELARQISRECILVIESEVTS